MNNEMTALIENIKEDYLNWTTRCAGAKGLDALTEINEKMIAEFDEGISYKAGSKYTKVVTSNSVWVSLSIPTTTRSSRRVTF